MASKKLLNPRFDYVRRWLFPGVLWNDAPPDTVSPGLVTVVDLEHWVPVPRYMAVIQAPAVAARTSIVHFENFVRFPAITGNLDTAKATQFVVTNLRVRQMLAGNSNSFVATRTKTDALGFTYDTVSTNPSTSSLGINTYSGSSAPFVQIFHSDRGAPGFGPVLYTAGDIQTWIDYPDLEPGNGIIFQGGIVNMQVQMHFSWTERRIDGQANVVP